MDFTEWIYKKFLEWRGDSRNTVTGFADYVGVSQQVMSNWMNPKGNIPRSQKAITALVNRYGNEVYEVLGLPVPENDSLLDGLPEQVKTSLTPALKEINSIYARKKVSPDSPEAVKIAEEVFSKYGFNITSISNVED